MRKIISFLILTICMLALLSVVASAVTLETEITAGELSVNVGDLEEWTITITICSGDEDLEDVVVQGGIGADLVVTGYYAEEGVVELIKKGKPGKMGATIVKWDISELSGGGDCITLELTVETGLNPKDKQEFTSAELGHELDGGFSASYLYEGIEYETPETIPLTVDVEGVEEE